MARKPTGRRRGGQPGNHNRLKHGMYARRLPPDHEIRLERLGLNRNPLTIALARARLNKLLDKQAAAGQQEFLSYERAIQYYINMITRLLHRNTRLALRTRIPSNDLRELIEMLKDL